MQETSFLRDAAQTYALAQHSQTGQLYDGLPYATHLSAVADFARQYSYLLHDDTEKQLALAGAYVHDVIEDCRVTFNDVKAATSVEVAEIAYLLATPKGRNRAERHSEAYYAEMAANKLATYVKICDRLANVAHSVAKQSRMRQLYQQEHAHFSSLLRPAWPTFEPMWNHLEQLLTSPNPVQD